MRSEREKMLSGELYDPLDPQLVAARQRARLRFKAFNDTRDDQPLERARLLRELLPHAGKELWIEPPFFCDYGSNLTLGDNVFFNFNCVVLDVAPIEIGDRVLFAPAVQIYAATHPVRAVDRQLGCESGEAVSIGDEMWIDRWRCDHVSGRKYRSGAGHRRGVALSYRISGNGPLLRSGSE